jgi:methionyl-tRNA formyltransferase
LLQKYRGAAPAAWTILNGEEKGGVTTMKLAEKMDSGPVYLQKEITLAPDETTSSLQAKLTPIGARLLLETIRRLKDGSLEPQAQNEADASFVHHKERRRFDRLESATMIEPAGGADVAAS